jgi:hypothetical protein
MRRDGAEGRAAVAKLVAPYMGFATASIFCDLLPIFPNWSS